MRAVLLVLFLLTLGLRSAWAGWSDAALNYQNSYDFDVEDGYLSTVWGSCHSPNPKWDRMRAKLVNWNVTTDELYYRTLPTKMALTTDHRARVKKAPVMFFIPGAFTNLDEKMPKHFIDRFTKLGYHVFVVPNPWGTQYVSRKPKTITGHIEAEAYTLYDVFKKAHRYLTEKGYANGEYHISGVSYGAFLSAMISGIAASDPAQVVSFKSTTIISPPLDLGLALDNLDSVLDETVDYTSMWLPRLARKYLSICRVDMDDVGRYSKRDAMGLAASQGFHVNLINSLRLYDKLWNLNTIPGNFWGAFSRSYRRWRKEMSFSKYFRQYNRGAAQIVDGPKGKLSYWIAMAREHSDTRIQVLMASDDFLNTDYTKSVVRNDLNEGELIELPTGGHFGFRALPWFDELLERAFSKEFY